jgi:hypothetical protein
MIGKIYGTKETDNPDGICYHCNCCAINEKNISPGFSSGKNDWGLEGVRKEKNGPIIITCDESAN